MSFTEIRIFAHSLRKKLSRESSRNVGEKWKVRASRLRKTFILACGGETMPGLVTVFGKHIRTDYLKLSLRQLSWDLPSKDTFFYKALPINFEKWVVALCTHDIATYTPRSWSKSHAVPRDLMELSTFAQLSIYNESPELVDFFTAFKQRLQQIGVRAREFNTREDYDTSLCVFQTQGMNNAFGCSVLAGDRLSIQLCNTAGMSVEPVVGVARPLVPIKPLRSLRPLLLQPSEANLAVEATMGIIVRHGTLMGVGSGEKLLALYATDQNGCVIKSYGDTTFAWKQIADRTTGIIHSLWVMKTAQYSVTGKERTTGMDVPLVLLAGVGVDDLLNARVIGEKTFSAICAQTATNVASKIREVMQRRIVAPVLSTRTDLVQQITRDMRKGSTSLPPEHLYDGAGTAVPLMPIEKVVPLYNVPKSCRNAWLLLDGSQVSVVDGLQRDAINRRVRLNGAKRCPACPANHPDSIRREQMVCTSPQCPSKFVFYTTMTHYVYKKANGRTVEQDINLPLFTDQVLSQIHFGK